MSKLFRREGVFIEGMGREVVCLFIAVAFIGLSQGFSESIWTNFYSLIGMDMSQRTVLEPIRELPGLLMMFIIAALSFLTIGRMGALAMAVRGVGMLLVGLLTTGFAPAFVAYMVVVSLGDHIFMPLRNSIGITVANHGYEGRVIGFMDATSTIMYMLPSLFILFFFNGNELRDYQIFFILAAVMAAFGGASLFLMRTRKAENLSRPRLVFKKKFTLYYLISFISGLRKQIYLVFAPWLLVKVFQQPVQTMTLLAVIGGATVFFFNPFMGHLIDRYGERKLLVGGGVIATAIYVAYAFLSTMPVTDSLVVFLLLALNYVDRLTQSTLMGRDIFVKHTADSPDEIMPTLSAGVSMDHIASVASPVFGGMLWTGVGPQWVFAAGAVIGIIFTVMCFLVPGKPAAITTEQVAQADTFD